MVYLYLSINCRSACGNFALFSTITQQFDYKMETEKKESTVKSIEVKRLFLIVRTT